MGIRFSRISAIYRKELIDILRDQRTLIAMIVVPIVLYPVLILGSLQAVSFQADQMGKETFTIAVPDEVDAEALNKLFVEDARRQVEAVADRPGLVVNPLVDSKFLFTEDLRGAVGNGSAEVGLRPMARKEGKPDVRGGFELVVDEAEVRSQVAAKRLEGFLDRLGRQVQREALRQIGQPQNLLDPIPVDRVNIARPEKLGGSVLSHIVPLVLVLMAVTGAIYPAIDLTAGERERGTLETLVACPIPVEEIIVGKFLVITTLSLIAASLNLLSIGLTMQVTGVQELLTDGQSASVPFAVLPIILLTMIPFAVLFSAVLIAVASFAKTFKEAQNYMVPVILAAMIPGMAAALPGTRLEGAMLVMPVGNMVLLTREFLLGHFEDIRAIILVLGSTCFYAVTAVVAASRLFGQEAVMFSDAASYKALFRRNLFRTQPRPTAGQALLLTAVLFPVWFYVQSGVMQSFGGDMAAGLRWIGMAMAAIIAGIPLAAAWYRKTNVIETFSLKWCGGRYVVAGVLIGCSAWPLAHELILLQGVSKGLEEQFRQLGEAVGAMPLGTALLLLAVIPAICEELLFRGYLLSGLRGGSRLGAIAAVGVIFGMYHFVLVRFLVTALLGMTLAYLCWQSRSIWPCMLAHVLHNATTLMISRVADSFRLEEGQHLPAHWIVGSAVLFIAGLLLCRHPRGAALSVPRAAPDAIQGSA